MPSWDWTPDHSWDCAERYEAELRAAERERMQDGWAAPDGWRRPVDPMCPAHSYGLVDGLCGVCVLELNAATESREAA